MISITRAKMVPMRRSLAAEEEAGQLFGGRWLPVTTHLTFLEGSVEDLVECFLGFRGPRVLELTGGHPLRVRPVTGDLEGLLEKLEPLDLESGPRRYLFIPCAAPTAPGVPWTCLLDNNWRGTDRGIASPFTFRGFRSVSISSSPCTWDRATNRGFYGIQEFGMYWADPEHGYQGISGRSVGIAQFETIRKWDFVDHGEPLPFEDLQRYTARRVRDRFDQQLLVRYAAAVGLRPFDEDFYAPDRSAVIVEHTEPPRPGAWQTDLAGARSGRPPEEIAWPARRLTDPAAGG